MEKSSGQEHNVVISDVLSYPMSLCPKFTVPCSASCRMVRSRQNRGVCNVRGNGGGGGGGGGRQHYAALLWHNSGLVFQYLRSRLALRALACMSQAGVAKCTACQCSVAYVNLRRWALCPVV